MPRYDASFDPPAPMALVALRNPQNGLVQRGVRMILDSGGDLSLVPHVAIDQINAVIEEDVFDLLGFDGSTSLARPTYVELEILNRRFSGYFLVLDREYGILGRDILNHLVITLDGPKLRWEPLSRESSS